MRKAVLALCALSLLTGCGGPVNAAEPPYEPPMPVSPRTVKGSRPLMIYTVEKCSQPYQKAYSPSMTDMPRFVLRLDRHRNYIQSGINLSCVQKLYSQKEIVYWKDKGGPVAILAYLDRKYREYDKLCNDYHFVKSLLRRARQVKLKVVENGEYIIRTPEAYIFEKRFDRDCLNINDGGLSRMELARHNIAADFFSYYTMD
jgi:hypothetical protein